MRDFGRARDSRLAAAGVSVDPDGPAPGAPDAHASLDEDGPTGADPTPDPADDEVDDETLAARARARYRLDRMPALEPDPSIAAELAAHEELLAVHRSAAVDRRLRSAGRSTEGVRGDLYLTSGRLVLMGHPRVCIPLTTIREVGLAGEQVVLVLGDGTGVAVWVKRPRLLRVEIAAARAAARSGAPDTGRSPAQ